MIPTAITSPSGPAANTFNLAASATIPAVDNSTAIHGVTLPPASPNLDPAISAIVAQLLAQQLERSKKESEEAIAKAIDQATREAEARFTQLQRDTDTQVRRPFSSAANTSTHPKHTLSQAALTECTRTSPELHNMTGENIKHMLLHAMSKHEMSTGKDEANVGIHINVGTQALGLILTGQIPPLCNFRSVSRQAAEDMGKLAPTRSALTGWPDTSEAWQNALYTIIRIFDFKANSPVLLGLIEGGRKVETFITERRNTLPKLSTGDFAGRYLTQMVQRFMHKFTLPHATVADIAALAESMTITEETPAYRIIKAQIDQEWRDDMEAKMDSSSSKQGNNSGSRKSNNVSGSQKPSSGQRATNQSQTQRAKSTALCNHFNSTIGCTRGDKTCSYTHAKAKTEAQKNAVRTQLKALNSRWPDKTPLVAAFGPE